MALPFNCSHLVEIQNESSGEEILPQTVLPTDDGGSEVVAAHLLTSVIDDSRHRVEAHCVKPLVYTWFSVKWVR